VPDATPDADGSTSGDAAADSGTGDAGSDGGPDSGPDGGEDDLDGDGYTVADGDCDDTDLLVNPARPDVPDLDARDTNCDGRDGVVTRDTYVDPTLSTAEIQVAIDECAAKDGCNVLFSVGTYSLEAALVLPSGARLFGGYSADYLSRNVESVDDPEQSTVLVGGTQRETLSIREQTGTVLLEGFRIVGPVSSVESYGIWISKSKDVRIRHSHVIGGKGGEGVSAGKAADGSAGGNANGTTGGSGCGGCNGGRGGVGHSQMWYTNELNQCTYASSSGPEYGSCGPTPYRADVNSRGCWVGITWCEVTTMPASPHRANVSGTLNATDHKQDGAQGACGAAGAAAAAGLGGIDDEGRWAPPVAGGNGQPGTTGGGGAGGWYGPSWLGVYCYWGDCATYGHDVVCKQQGSNGGGGGGGGCPGAGGAAGGHGHASIAILAHESKLDLVSVVVLTGTGGNGGSGGAGGNGGKGGNFALNSTLRSNVYGCVYSDWMFCPSPDWNKAGLGEAGGAGGSGGGGGGGAGGHGGFAIAIAVSGSTVTADGLSVDTSAGQAGTGGNGGAAGSTPHNVYNINGASCSAGAGAAGLAGQKLGIHTF
jgi:hypothetical protein